MSGDVGADVAAVLAAHRLEVESRCYPAYACSCEKWDGAKGDNGGPSDGQNDNPEAHAAHVADALAHLIAARVEAAKAEALREASEAAVTLAEDDIWSPGANALRLILDTWIAALDPSPRA